MAAASPPSTETCNARTRADGVCRNRAGFKTTHPGIGRCTYHGGSSPNGEVNAARLEAARLGAELQLDPHEALLLTVRRAAAAEQYWARSVQALTDAQVVKDGGSVNAHVREHQRAIDQLARCAKTALDAGVDERRVRLAEQLVGDIANAIDIVLTRLGVRDHPEAPAAVREALAAVEAPRLLEAAA